MRMRFFRYILLCMLLSVVVPGTVGCSKGTHDRTAAPAFSLNDTLSLREACGKVSSYLSSYVGPFDTSLSGFNASLDSAAAFIRKKNGNKTQGPEALDGILNSVYSVWSIGFDPRDTLIENFLPHLVYKNRKGSCLGISLVILILAEKLDLPVYGVMLPGHFFCRYDDGRTRINLEPNRKGCEHPDEYYLKRYPLENQPWYGMKNIDKKETVGMLCYNAGAACLRGRKYDAAVTLYREAMRRIPDFAEAKGNCAISYARKGELDIALALFDTLFSEHPDMPNLAANYGYVAVAAKRYLKAVEVYREGLKYFPGDTLLQKRLKKISTGLMFFPEKRKIE